MKRCPTCNTNYDSSIINCSNCGFEPAVIDGFKCYAPQYSHEGGGFKASYFADLVRFEENNFWFRARNKLILWMLKHNCPDLVSFLEIGCGTGYVLSGVADQFPNAKLSGSEIFFDGLGFAAARLPTTDLMQMDARDIPFHEEFEAIGAFDVLEHIEEDDRVLKQVHEALIPSGFLVLTVPQHKWLWSATDEHACHVRRYTAPELHRKIESAGFNIIRSTSFVTTLLPAMMASRMLPEKVFDAASEFKISPWLNAVFYALLVAEIAAIKLGISFPIGGSRIVVAQKTGVIA